MILGLIVVNWVLMMVKKSRKPKSCCTFMSDKIYIKFKHQKTYKNFVTENRAHVLKEKYQLELFCSKSFIVEIFELSAAFLGEKHTCLMI